MSCLLEERRSQPSLEEALKRLESNYYDSTLSG